MEQVVEALEQIEQAAEISKNDATRNAEVAQRCVDYINEAKSETQWLYESINSINEEFDNISNLLKNIKTLAESNSKLAEERKIDLNFVKSRINSLNNTIRKIEIAIVQVAALSINGAVEAIRVGELGEDDVQEENDIILVEINNIFLNQNSEIEKLQKIEYELKRNKESLLKVKNKVEQFLNSINEMVTALEQSKIAADQIKEAAELSSQNASQSKEAANIILTITRDMRAYITRLSELANSLT